MQSSETVCKTILLVEDNADARDALRMLLGLLVHKVIDTASGQEALQLITAGSIACALLDIGLPDVDGYELARRIRAAAPEVRLIALTGYGQPEDKARAVAAGFDYLLTKPISTQKPSRRLRRHDRELSKPSRLL